MIVTFNVFLVCFLSATIGEAIATSTIDTIPMLPNNVLATGYSGLTIRAQFKKVSIQQTCAWSDGGVLDARPFYFGSTVGNTGCANTSLDDFTISCINRTIGEIDYLISNLTFIKPLNASQRLSVNCDQGKVIAYNLEVQECPHKLGGDVIVESSTRVYGANGTFNCSNNGKLFYSNDTNISTEQTSCTVSTMWSGQKNLQCWAAPSDVFISGNLTGNNGTYLILSCVYENVIPFGNISTFHFGNSYQEIPYMTKFMLLLQLEYDRTPIYCQANTSYTQRYPTTGKSSNYVINVQYKPYQSKKPIECKWNANQLECCNVSFKANPVPSFSSLVKNSSLVTNDVQSTIINETYPTAQFRLCRYNVTLADHGKYELVVKSSAFPEKFFSIFFAVVVDDGRSTTPIPVTSISDFAKPSTDNNLIIIICCVAGAVLLLIITLSITIVRRWAKSHSPGDPSVHANQAFEGGDSENSEKQESVNPLYVSSDQPDQVACAYAAVDKKDKTKKKNSEKQESVNPLYVSSDQPDQVACAYAAVDKKDKTKKKNSEKQESVNPLYVSSDQPDQVACAYAAVDKKDKKKKNRKEEHINPLYAPTSQNVVEDAYAEVDFDKNVNCHPKVYASQGTDNATNTQINSGSTYAEVKKPKKKPPTSQRNQEVVGADTH